MASSGNRSAGIAGGPPSQVLTPSQGKTLQQQHQQQSENPDPKNMKKAERRELQEGQRAAKTASLANRNPASAGAKSSTGTSQTQKRGSTLPMVGVPDGEKNRRPDKDARGLKDGGVVAHSADEEPVTCRMRIFSHFFTISNAPSPVNEEVHSAILNLGLQFSNLKIVGANARCIATLSAFKTIIQGYIVPPKVAFHIALPDYLDGQANHLASARPMAVTMLNAIRQLRCDITGINTELAESEAKEQICDRIDEYLRNRILYADQVISKLVVEKIQDGDVILTFARSSVVEKTLLFARQIGKRISVIVVDSRPMLEGKNLVSILSTAKIPCSYLLLPAIGSVISTVDKVLLGTHSIHANGAAYSRAGTAIVALMAKMHGKPTLVCCETYKFADNVILDSFTKNQLAPNGDPMHTVPSVICQDSLVLAPKRNLDLVNPLYDLTPPTHITAIVTEAGIIPPNSLLHWDLK